MELDYKKIAAMLVQKEKGYCVEIAEEYLDYVDGLIQQRLNEYKDTLMKSIQHKVEIELAKIDAGE